VKNPRAWKSLFDRLYPRLWYHRKPARWQPLQYVSPVDEEVTVGAFRERQTGAGTAAKIGACPEDAVFLKKWPAICEFISEIRDAEGRPMKGATLMLFAEDGCYKLCLHDRLGSCSLWASSDSHFGVYDALEKRLASGTGDWRRDREPLAKGRKQS
jgi:hypothetical protein